MDGETDQVEPAGQVASGSWPDEKRARVLLLAAAWGCSAAYVYQLLKKGLPLDSADQANSWRREHCRLGIGYRSKGGNGSPKIPSREGEGSGVPRKTRPDVEAGEFRPRGPRKRVKLDSLEASLRQAIEMEEESARAVHECLDDPDRRDSLLTAMNAFNKAQQNRMEREAGVLKLLEAQKKLIQVDAAIELITRVWGPLLQRLRSAPKRAALKANPTDDALAEEVFSEEIEDAISEASKTYEDVLSESQP